LHQVLIVVAGFSDAREFIDENALIAGRVPLARVREGRVSSQQDDLKLVMNCWVTARSRVAGDLPVEFSFKSMVSTSRRR
jgi:hypothetical protein